MKLIISIIALLAPACIVFPALGQDTQAAQKQLAQDVPIADVHMHLFPALTPQEALARMDRNNVRWAGGVGALRKDTDLGAYSALLGKRYFPAGGQPEMGVMWFSGGASELVNAEGNAFKGLLAKADQDFQDGKIQGIGELILNNRASHPQPNFRRKVQIDAPTFVAMFQLAEKHGGFVQIHTEDDSDSLQGLENLAREFPNVPIILSHCLARATASTAKALLEKHPNMYCETSARSSVILSAPSVEQHQIHDQYRARSQWVELMESMPDRFMVGSDDTGHHSYDAIIGTIRTGLLPHLSEATMKKVAYENAVRVFKLDPTP